MSVKNTARANGLSARGLIFLQQSDLKRAAACFERAISCDSRHTEAVHYLGLTLLLQGQVRRAQQLLVKAARLDPGSPVIQNNLGLALVQSGDRKGAEQCFCRAIHYQSGYVDARANLARLHKTGGQIEKAITQYHSLLELAPERLGERVQLADLLEKGHRLAEAAAQVDRVLERRPDDSSALLIKAQIFCREKQYESAGMLLKNVLSQEGLTADNYALAWNRYGIVCDKRGDTEKATEAFTACNQLQSGLPDVEASSTHGLFSLDGIYRIRTFFSDLAWVYDVEGDYGDSVPRVFLVGFPRSGTTLLDQILSSHSGIYVLEEEQTLNDICEEMLTRFSGTGSERFPKKLVARYRQQYARHIQQLVPKKYKKHLIVDKLPLNTALLGFIRILFPDARIIFAVRDPRDVCLSCFMQYFQPNTAMSYFLDLKSTAAYYDAVMGLGLRLLSELPIESHLLRYEDLIEQPREQMEALIHFLGLAWEEAMLDFASTARARYIRTPSYTQVTQPLYSSGVQRWQRYQYIMKPILPVLNPYVLQFGYAP